MCLCQIEGLLFCGEVSSLVVSESQSGIHREKSQAAVIIITVASAIQQCLAEGKRVYFSHVKIRPFQFPCKIIRTKICCPLGEWHLAKYHALLQTLDVKGHMQTFT